MKLERFVQCGLVGALLFPWTSAASAAPPVWVSTFDSSADGVVDLFNGEPGKQMIGPATNGRLQIETWDNNTFVPDKAGRPLGATLTGNNSMSARYRFNWSTLNQSETPQTYDAFGFLGNSSPQTRQILGGIFRHWRVGASDYYVSMDIAAGSTGFSPNFGYLAGPTAYLGTNPTANDYELRIEYDGPSHVIALTLLDSGGTTLLSHSGDLDTIFTGNQALELSTYALNHLGWSDYTGNGGNRATVWQVNSLAYYNSATIPEPSTLVFGTMLLGMFAASRRRR